MVVGRYEKAIHGVPDVGDPAIEGQAYITHSVGAMHILCRPQFDDQR